MFARPADQVQPPSRNGIPQSGYSARIMLGIEAKIDESLSYPGMIMVNDVKGEQRRRRVEDGKAISIDKGSREPPAFSPQFRAGGR